MGDVHAWATGQDDNIGDTLLRRALLSEVASADRLSLFVGGAGPDFVDALGAPPGTRRFASFPRWVASAAAAALAGGGVLLLNAGEVAVSRRGGLRVATLVPLIWLTRARGGRALWLGAGTPVLRRGWVPVYRAAARSCQHVSWRDRETQRLMGCGTVVADLGFALGTPVEAWSPVDARGDLVVTLRGDRPAPSQEWLSWVRGTAAGLGLRVVVVSQVGSDQARGEELARALDGDLLPWRGSDHRANEQQVRQAYARARIVVSDRLHALVVAATEGSVPLGWVPSGRGKVRRHFDAVGLPWVGAHDGAHEPPTGLDGAVVDGYRTELAVAVAAARADLASQAALVRAAVGASGRP